MTVSVFDRVENIVGKEKMLVNSIFFFFPQCFQKSNLSVSLQVGTVWQS